MNASVNMRRNTLAGRLGVALMAALVLSGCGLRTRPEPLSRQIPAPQGVRIWQRENSVLVAWTVPPAGVVALYGAAKSYEVTVKRLPLGCLDCNAVSSRGVDLRPGDKQLILEGDWAYYQFEHIGPPASWSVRVTAHLKRGTSTQSPLVFVEDVAPVPTHVLQWDRRTEGEPTIRLYWGARRERRVKVLTKAGGQVEQDIRYRANVYLRVPPAPWPLTPANPAPLEDLMWTIQESLLSKGGQALEVQAMLRLVDRFGNEGPASSVIGIPLGRGASP